MGRPTQIKDRVSALGAAGIAARSLGAMRPPSLRVAMDVGFPDDPGDAVAAVHVHVSGGRPPVRVHIYVNGELAAVQCGTGLIYDLPAGRVVSGSHTIAVRASDALGRWADSSMQLDLPLSESALTGLEAAPAPATGTTATWSIRRLVAKLWR